MNFGMADDVAIICDDVRNRTSELAVGDVIVLNNVFQFFLPPQDQMQCWQFLKQHVKKGAVIVSNPALAIVTSHLSLDFALNDWVDQVRTCTVFTSVSFGSQNCFFKFGCKLNSNQRTISAFS